MIKNNNPFIARLDGTRCLNKKQALYEIGRAFNFPDYYGENLDALDECLNDLSWIKLDSYLLIINNFDKFLSSEKDELKLDFIDLFNETSNSWLNVPNYEGESEHRKKSKFMVIYKD
ncbi:barstar family protein [Psychroserpens sp.]